jgi:RHS repeat-associated protein
MLIALEEFFPFGTTSNQSGRSITETGLRRYRYTGKERDQETGLIYFGARYYAPWVARWCGSDPASIEAGINTYCYVSNDPIGKIDPDGRWEVNWSQVGKGALIAAAVVVAVVVVVVTVGAAAPILASGAALALGATAETALVVAATTTGVVKAATVALSVYGVAQLGKSTVEVATGREIGSGKKLSNDERSEKLGEVAVGWATIGLSAKLSSKPSTRALPTEKAPKVDIANSPVGAKPKVAEPTTTPSGRGTSNASAAKTAKSPQRKGTDEHHSDPKFLGGDPKQPTTKLPRPEHKDLHQELNNFLRAKEDANGNHMRPQKGNSGSTIRSNFSREERLEAMSEFYKTKGAQYKEAAVDFFKQHPHLR